MSILFSQVPKYLHNFELYLSLKEDNDFEITNELPPETVNTIDDYILLFSIYNRWVNIL